MIPLFCILIVGSVISEPVFQILPAPRPLVTPPLQAGLASLISFDQIDGDGSERAVNEIDQLGDIFQSLYEAVLFSLKQHVSFKIKSPEGVVYLYDLLCERSGHCDVKIQSRTKNRKGTPTEALNLFLKENGDFRFTQPELKLMNITPDILQTLKGTNERLKVVDELWTKTYKMKDIGDKKKAQFVLEVLRAHNKLREHHETAVLTLEKKLMEDAQSYADKCARSGKIEPRSQVPSYGENIWGLTTNATNIEDLDLHGGRPVEKWYSEAKKYKFGEEPADNTAGHLTQMLWSKTKYLGVGISANDNGQIFVICEYYPPGNYLGDYAANVKPLKKPFTNEDAEEISIPSLTHLTISNGSTPGVPGSTPSHNKTSGNLLIQTNTLQFHNEKRHLHAVQSLKYLKELESLAQDWAQHLLKNGTFYHRPDNTYGENIYYYTATFYLTDKESIRKAVDAWYNEIDFYKSFDKEPSVEELTMGNPTGHFTQVVWNATTHVGLGIARKDSENEHLVVVVANYAPAGNVLGRFRENVFRSVNYTKKDDKDAKTAKPTTATVKHFEPSINVLDEHSSFKKSDGFELSRAVMEKRATGSASKPAQSLAAKDSKQMPKSAKNVTAVKNSNTVSKSKTTASSTTTTSKPTSGSGLSTKIGSTSETSKVKDGSEVVIRRETRGVKMFGERIAEMGVSPKCPKKK